VNSKKYRTKSVEGLLGSGRFKFGIKIKRTLCNHYPENSTQKVDPSGELVFKNIMAFI
jgi:hypothetical protein